MKKNVEHFMEKWHSMCTFLCGTNSKFSDTFHCIRYHFFHPNTLYKPHFEAIPKLKVKNEYNFRSTKKENWHEIVYAEFELKIHIIIMRRSFCANDGF